MAKIAKKSVDQEKLTVTFDFADGTTVTTDLSEFPEAILDRLSLHGLSQKLGDSYAGAESITEAVQSVKELLTNLQAGNWNLGGRSTGGIWIEVLVRISGKSAEECAERFNALSEDEKKKLKKHPQVLLIKAEIEKERLLAAAEKNPVEVLDFDTLGS